MNKMKMENEEYEKIIKLGYGELLITDEKGNVIGTSCNHYYDDSGECIFCGKIKFNSYLYRKLYGGE